MLYVLKKSLRVWVCRRVVGRVRVWVKVRDATPKKLPPFPCTMHANP